jgi:hypothetical protein
MGGLGVGEMITLRLEMLWDKLTWIGLQYQVL